MLENTGIGLQPANWARAVLGAIIMAAKVWDDHAVWNVDFCQIFPDVDGEDLYYARVMANSVQQHFRNVLLGGHAF
jgi:hypothetical protein